MKELECPYSNVNGVANQQIKTSLYTYFGDSLYRLRYFKRALRAFEQALAFNDSGTRRSSKRFKSISSLTSGCDINKIIPKSINTNENELKYRIHLCLIQLNDIREAQTILEKIPNEERSMKILTSLADLYGQEKNVDLAQKTYLEILKRDPIRLDIVIKLCKLGGCEAYMILNVLSDDVKRTWSWYPTWIQAQCDLHSTNSKQAIRLFENLTSRFERTAPILTSLAEAHYHDGNFKEAIRIYQIAYSCDPDTLAGVDCYAACLRKEQSKRPLEDLAANMLTRCPIEGEYFHEPWLVLAHYYSCKDSKDPSKAYLFVSKAYKLNKSSLEALVLLASLCQERKDPAKAQAYVMSAQVLAPYRYEVQRVLCDTLLAQNKKSAALNFAKNSTKSLGKSPRSFYLYADILLKLQDTQKRKVTARNCLERAVKLDKDYLPAVFALSELLIDDKRYDQAAEILTMALPNQPSNKTLHKYLGTCYKELKDHDKALHHQALSSEDNLNTFTRINDDHLHTISQDPPSGQEESEALLGLEADEYVDHGDSEDEVNVSFLT